MSIKKFGDRDNRHSRDGRIRPAARMLVGLLRRQPDVCRSTISGRSGPAPFIAISRALIQALLALAMLVTDAASAEKLRILHTNDLHSHLVPFVTLDGDTVGGAARLASLLKREEAAEPNHLYLDAGDLFQGTPFYNFFRGEAELRVMTALGCDAMALGNHELDNGPANLLEKVRDYAKFPILCSNVLVAESIRDDVRNRKPPADSPPKDDTRVPIGRPWTLLHAGNLRVGVIGVTTETLPFIVTAKNLAGVTVESMIEHVRSLMSEVRAQSDVVIVLSHCGLRADSALVVAVPGIDVVISAHDHQTLAQAMIVRNDANTSGIGGTLLVETGHSGRNLGRLDLAVENGRITSWHDTLLAVTPRLPEDSLVAAIVSGYQSQVAGRVSEVIATAAVPLVADSSMVAETALGDLVTDLIREEAGTDIAFQNGGGIRTSINQGPIRLGDLFELLPFDNTIVTVRLNGGQVRSLCQGIVARRGTGGFGQVSGLAFEVVAGRPSAITVNGKPLEPSREYTIATNNFTAGGGDGWTLFRQGADYTDTGIVLRDAIVKRLRQQGTVEPKVEGRIRFR